MKTAMEALLETAQNEHSREIQIVQEKEKCRTLSAQTAEMWCEGIIQKQIEEAIKNRSTSIQITLILDTVTFSTGVRYQCWKMIPNNSWDRGIYNPKARGYYLIPKREGFIIHPNEIVDILKKAGYNIRIVDTTVSEATSRTGKYANPIAARDITISWNPILI